MPSDVRFTKKTLDFLASAGTQTSPDWLKANSSAHKELVIAPLAALAAHLVRGLAGSPDARGYKLPRRGFGRLRRPSHKVQPGHPAYRNWVQLQSARARTSIFDDNPRLYFYASPTSIYAGGGVDEPSSRQIKRIRAWLADEPEALVSLLKSRAFKKQFPDGFDQERILKTLPRHYPPTHPRIQWLRLQAFWMQRSFTKKEFYSAEFADLVLENWRQTLLFNEQLFEALDTSNDHIPFVPARDADDEDVEDEDETPDRNELWDERL